MSIQARLTAIVGEQHVLSGLDAAPYETEWRQRVKGKALCVVKPKTDSEVAQIAQLCNETRTPLIPQGGNTGLVLGSIPDASSTAVILNLTRMNEILAIDLDNDTITVQAGCVLQAVQTAAAQAGKLFPLSLAAQGSCTIGGNLATNAGGTQVLRWGNTRELCLGLRFITAQGEMIENLSGLRKDNTGYDLRHLMIGAEGTLGIITAATFKLFPMPVATLTAWVQLDSVENAVALLRLARQAAPSGLTGFELISQRCVDLVKSQNGPPCPLPAPSAWSVLMELSDWESAAHCTAVFESILEGALENGIATDAAIAQSSAQSLQMWALREFIPEAQQRAGKNIKHDISIPISKIAQFVRETEAQLHAQVNGCVLVNFGHLGDGNLHYNVEPPAGCDFDEISKQVNEIVYASVMRFGGSISAEHGIGRLKRGYLPRVKSPSTLVAYRAIKAALDPNNILNPGVIL